MIPLDKGLQWVNVEQKPLKQIQAHSGIIKRIQNLCKTGISRTVAYSKPETYSESWYIQYPGVLKTLAYSKPKAYSDIHDVKHLR